MISRNLFCRLQKEDIKRRPWPVVLVFLLFFLALPVSCAMTIENQAGNELYDAEYLAQMLTNAVGVGNVAIILISILGAVIFGLSGFFYLHSRKKVDLYHSMPVRREVQYAVIYVNGLGCYVVSYLINLLLCFLLLQMNGFMDSGIFMGALAAIAINVVFYSLIYTITIIAVMLTGNIIVSCLGTAVFLAYGPLLVFVRAIYFGEYFATYYGGDIDTAIFNTLSPIGIYLVTGFRASSVKESEIIWMLIKVSAVTVALIACSVFLYKKRPSEAAGSAMAFDFVKPIIKFMLVVPLSLGGGILFQYISGSRALEWNIFGTIFTMIIIYAVIEMIYNFDIRSAFRNKIQFAACAAAIAAVVMVFRFDFIKYDSYLPGKDKVESMSISFEGMDENLSYVPGMDEQGLAYSRVLTNRYDYEIEGMELTDFTSVYELAELGAARAEEISADHHRNGAFYSNASGSSEQERQYRYYVKFKLKSGREIYRVYSVPADEAEAMVSDLYGDTKYKEAHYSVYRYKMEDINTVHCWNINTGNEITVNRGGIEKLLELYREELKGLTWDERTAENPVAVLNIESKMSNEEYFIYSGFEQTIAFITEQGLDLDQKVWEDELKELKVVYTRPSSDENGNAPIESDESLEKSVIYTDKEQIREILGSILSTQYYWCNDSMLNVDPDLTVWTGSEFSSEYGYNEEGISFYMNQDRIPEFVLEDIGYKE